LAWARAFKGVDLATRLEEAWKGAHRLYEHTRAPELAEDEAAKKGRSKKGMCADAGF
jgi:hypothetical protein